MRQPLIATLFVTIVWVVAVFVVVPDEPVLTLVLAGVAYAVAGLVARALIDRRGLT